MKGIFKIGLFFLTEKKNSSHAIQKKKKKNHSSLVAGLLIFVQIHMFVNETKIDTTSPRIFSHII